MVQHEQSLEIDKEKMAEWIDNPVDSSSVHQFVPGPGIQKLDLKFDIEQLKKALKECLNKVDSQGNYEDLGFGAFSLTRRPGAEVETPNDLSGRYWLRAADTYQEEPREELVNEFAFTEFVPRFAGTYFEHVHNELTRRFAIGRTRILSKGLYNCNSWHRDPEPRLHIPIITNPGSLFIVNHHVTHMPADGSVYFTDTRGYHTAINGGETKRVHLVAALPQKDSPK